MTIASMPVNIQLDTTAQSPRWSRFDLVNMFKSFKRRRAAFRQTTLELSQLSDRDLKDIGIGRSDIRRLARIEALKA